MSRYGRLWEDAREYRQILKHMLPGLVYDFTPADARAALRAFVVQVESRLAAWEALEEKMKRTND